jgi:hypothetical protein
MSNIQFLKMSFLALVLFNSTFATANDSSIGDDNGTIVFKSQPNISMDKESLLISEKNIQVDYVFTNTSQTDLVVPIAFPMPAMYFGSSDHGEIKDFKLWVDGKSIKTERKLVILLEGKTDISKKVAEFGWSENELTDYIGNGFVEDVPPKGKTPLPKSWFGEDGVPLFTLNEYFIWQQKFPARKSVVIKHSYSPSISTGVPQSAQFLIEEYAKTACIDKSAQFDMKKHEPEFGLYWANVSYILMTANYWQGAIKDFKLTVKKQNAKDVVSLCFDGEMKKTDPLTFEFHQLNFKPTQNLDLLFTRKSE